MKEEEQTRGEKAAYKINEIAATWKYILIQFCVIGLWFWINPFHDPVRGHLDLTISIWTLLLDNIIIMSSTLLAVRQVRQSKYMLKLIEAQAEFQEEERRIHKKLESTQQDILRKLRVWDSQNL